MMLSVDNELSGSEVALFFAQVFEAFRGHFLGDFFVLVSFVRREELFSAWCKTPREGHRIILPFSLGK